MKKILSIIIPVYNLENYIKDCLDSIIKQSNDNIELILIDDGSTDNSKDICKYYANKYEFIKYFFQKNAGVSSARNNGLCNSTGDYVWFVDGDDLLANNSIEIILKIIKENGNVDIISGNEIKFINKIKCNQSSEIKYNNAVSLLNTKGHIPNLHARILRRSLIINSNIKSDSHLKYTEDMDYFLSILQVSKKVILIDNILYYYKVIRTGSATSKISEKRLIDMLYFIEKWYNVNTKGYENIESLRNFAIYQYQILIGLFNNTSKDVHLQLINKVKKYEKLLSEGKGCKGKFINLIYKIFGFKTTSIILGLYIKIK